MQEALNCGGKNKDDWVQGNVSLEFCRLKTKNNAELAREEETAVEKVHITLKSGFPPPTSTTPTCCTLEEGKHVIWLFSCRKKMRLNELYVTWKKWLCKTRRHMREEEMWRSSISWGQDTVINLPKKILNFSSIIPQLSVPQKPSETIIKAIWSMLPCC